MNGASHETNIEMERMAGRVAGDSRFEAMGGVVNRSIASEHNSHRIRVSR